ncbi:MAG: hypothetical protein AB1806_18360 [Acidobacteriota bacterium]
MTAGLRSAFTKLLAVFGLASARSVHMLTGRLGTAGARAAALKSQLADVRAKLKEARARADGFEREVEALKLRLVEAESGSAAWKTRAETLEQQVSSARVAAQRLRGRAMAEELKATSGSGTVRVVSSGDETLVMTATFTAAATPYLVIRDEHERTLHYLCALVSWAQPKRVRRVVLAENSNTGFDFSRIVRFLEAAGKEVEVLVFDGNTHAAQRGKGYGDGEILEHVFAHSRLLRMGETFYKISGRVFVRNFDLVSELTTSAEAFFRKIGKPGQKPKANTVFFRCGLQVFEDRLLDAYRQVDEPNGVYLEHLYFDRLRDVRPPDFGERPAFVGQQASTGKAYEAYDVDTIRLARSFLA